VATNISVNSAVVIKLGYERLVVGQLDTGDSSEVFLSLRQWNFSGPQFRFPLVEAPSTPLPSKTAKYCHLCGEELLKNARFCGSCGAGLVEEEAQPPVDSRSFRSRLVDSASDVLRLQEAGSETASGFEMLRAAVFAVAHASLVAQELPQDVRDNYLVFLDALNDKFSTKTLELVQVIDGVESTSAKALNLALAQEIGRKAEGGEVFTPQEEAGLRVLLTEAPFAFGYWAPFKKVLKAVNPERYPLEFAHALDRLSSSSMKRISGRQDSPFEDLSVLADFSSVASGKTLGYLRRQQLRKYRNLCESDPDSFVLIATKYLLRRDSRPPRNDIIEAFILLGGGTFRDKWSRRAVPTKDVPVFNPPAVGGWDSHPDYLMEIWTTVTRRGVLQAFAFQGLSARNAILSELTGSQLALALRSGYEPLVAYAVDQITQRPETWKSLRAAEWGMLLGHADEKSRNEFLEHPSFPLLAIQKILELGDDDLSANAVSIFINRFQEWDEAKYSLDIPLWTQVISNANATQLAALFEHVFSVAEGEKYVSNHLRNATQALGEVIAQSWETLPTISSLAYLLIKVSGSKKFATPSETSASLAIFVLSLHRNYLGSGWLSGWGKLVTLGALAGALVLMNQEGEAREKNLPQDFHGGNAQALDELVQLLVGRLEESRSEQRAWLLASLWRTFASEPGIGAGLYLLRHLPTAEHFTSALGVVQRDTDRDIEETARLCTVILKYSDGSPLPDLRASVEEREGLWRSIDFELLLHESATLRRAIWEMVDSSDSGGWLESVIGGSGAATTLFQELHPEDFTQPNDAKARILIALMSKRRALAELPRDSAMVAATSQNTDIARLGLEALRSQKALADVWLRLVESELPIPTAAGFAVVEGIRDKTALTDALLLVIDSAVPGVRRRGLQLIDTLGERLDRERLFVSLSESEDAQVRSRVAEEALFASWATGPQFESFDDQILIARRRARKAKELVKQRLDAALPEGYQPTPERIAVLLDLAKHGKPRDAEWAYQRLAQFALAGISVDQVKVSRVSEGANRG